jgi:hypothetical protein
MSNQVKQTQEQRDTLLAKIDPDIELTLKGQITSTDQKPSYWDQIPGIKEDVEYNKKNSMLFYYESLKLPEDEPSGYSINFLTTSIIINVTKTDFGFISHHEVNIELTPNTINQYFFQHGCSHNPIKPIKIWCKCFGKLDGRNLPSYLRQTIKLKDIPKDAIMYVSNVTPIDWSSSTDIEYIRKFLNDKQSKISNLKTTINLIDDKIKPLQQAMNSFEELKMNHIGELAKLELANAQYKNLNAFVTLQISYNENMKRQQQLSNDRRDLHTKLVEIDKEQITLSEQMKQLASQLTQYKKININ